MRVYHKALLFIGLLIGFMLLLHGIIDIRITKMTDQFGPRLLPLILCIYIFLSSSMLVIFSKKNNKINKIELKSAIYASTYYASMFVYILSMQYLGFFISSLIFVVLSAAFLGGENITKKLYVFFCLLITIVIAYCFFEYILHMNLPKGLIMNGVL